MELDGLGSADVVDILLALFDQVQAWAARQWAAFEALRKEYPDLLSIQTAAGVVGTAFGIWRWLETREARLFSKFERMIEREEAQLTKARTDLLDAINRPGPGLVIRQPVFIERALRTVLARRRLLPLLSIGTAAKAVDAQLDKAVETCGRKVSAHLHRLSLFREQIVSAQLLRGALAAGRAARVNEVAERQRLDQEALDHFRGVLALPGHQDDTAALELVAHQLLLMEGRSPASEAAYLTLVSHLEGQQEAPARNVPLARARRHLAIIKYPVQPKIALDNLVEARALLVHFGPPRDRDLLEYAETVHLEAITRLRLGQVVEGPRKLSEAQGLYRSLVRSLDSRRLGLFRWMRREQKYAGHRVKELRERARQGLATVDHHNRLASAHPKLLFASLRRGTGAPRRTRKLPR